MESNDEQPELVDLLYDDELDEEKADEMRGELVDSPSERAELESYERMLSRIREQDVEQEVPEDVHDAIVDQAREAARDRSEQKAKPDRRDPRARDDGGAGTLWERIAGGTNISQVAVAAAALLACGVVFYMSRATFVGGDEAESVTAQGGKFDEAGQESEEKVEFAAGDQAPAQQEAGSDDEGTKAGDDDSDRPSAVGELESPSGLGTESSRGKRGDSESVADLDEPPQPDEPLQLEGDEKQRQKRRAPSPSGASREESDSSPSTGETDSAKVADNQSPSDDGKAYGRLQKDEDESSAALDDMAGLDALGSQSSGGSSSSSDSSSTKSKKRERSSTDESAEGETADDNSGVADIFGGGGDESTADDEGGAVEGSKKQAATAEANETKETGDEVDLAEEGPSIDDVVSPYERGDWDETIAKAEAVLESENAESRQKARALELKARALDQKGALDRAYATFVKLASDYPSYKQDAIQKAQRRLKRRRASRRAAAESDAEEQADEAETSADDSETSASEPAPPENSSDEPSSLEAY